MRPLLSLLLLLLGCATPARTQHPIAFRPSRLRDCAIEVYGANRPVPPELVALGTVPLTVGVYSSDASIVEAISPRACEAGATAVELRSSGATRPVGGGQRIKEVELVFLAPPEDRAVTETNALGDGLATGPMLAALRRLR